MSDRLIIDWTAWTASAPGRYVLRWAQEQLDYVVSDVFGFHALQLGLPQLDALRANRMPCRSLLLDVHSVASSSYTILRPYADAADVVSLDVTALTKYHVCTDRSTVWCNLLDLPLAAQSVDLIVMPHTLEFTNDPYRLLCEAARVLMPEGQLIIIGFNALSLWGMRQSISKMVNRPLLPVEHDLITFTRLKNWIKLLGFELERGRFGCYRPPLVTDRWLARYAFMEAVGDRWWPIFGAIYMLRAIKRVQNMCLVGPVTVKKPVLVPGFAPAATPHSRYRIS